MPGPEASLFRERPRAAGRRGQMNRSIRAVAFGITLVMASVSWTLPLRADDAPPPPPLPSPLEALFQPAKEKVRTLPWSFLADTDLRVHFRSYYFNRTNPNDTDNETWAFGGWASCQSVGLLDVFAMGAAVCGSAPLYAPDDRDGTLLLKPGQDAYIVPGEAWGAL